jgi:hypothetical protein
MSISAIAAQLYTIQSKKNVPLKTAFGMMVREDLAMRFSVYNLAKIITKSEFLATVAQTAFGARTPLQRKQDEAEQNKEIQEKRFKQFTASSITNLSNKINLLAGITERNTALISGIYSELGAFRMQRRMNVNNFNARAFRIPAPSKTIKAQLEQINSELANLQKKEKRAGVRGVTAKKSPSKEKKEEANLFSQFLPFILSNPKLLALLGVGALKAVGLGTLAAQAYSLYNLPGAAGRIASRIGGKPAYDSPITEQTSQFVDTGIATLGTYTATRAITGAASMFKNRGKSRLAPVSAKDARAQIQGNMQREFMNRGMSSQQAFGKASKRSAQFVKYSAQLKKFKAVDSVFRGLGKRLPAVQLAAVVFELSRMANYTADRSSGMSSQIEYKENMTNSYHNLIENVGMPAMGAALGGLAGTALFPGVGTSIGLFGGALGGWLTTFFLDHREIAEKVFSMIHEDRTEKSRNPITDVPDEDQGGNRGAGGGSGNRGGGGGRGRGPSSNADPSKYPTTAPGPKSGPLSVRNNNPGNLRYYSKFNRPGYVLENALPGPEESFAMFPTPELGVDAMRRQLIVDTRKGMVLSALINKYAPKGDGNDPVEYANTVSRETGVKLNEVIPLDRIRHVMSVMIRVEGKQEAIDYYKPFLQMPSVARPTATPVDQVIPQLPSAMPNTPTQLPPESAPPTADNRTTELEETQVNATAAMMATGRLNQKVAALAERTSNRILSIESLSKNENPGYKHNDPTLNYTMNV